MFMFVCVRHMTAFMSCVALGLCFRQGNNYLYTVSGFVAHVSGDHFVAYVRAQNQWLLCNDATVSIVSVLGPVWPCLIVLERLRRQQLARPARQAPPAGSDCLRRLPRLLQETVAPGPDAPGPRAAGAPPGTAAARAVGSRLGRFAAALQRKRREASCARAGQLGWERSIGHCIDGFH